MNSYGPNYGRGPTLTDWLLVAAFFAALALLIAWPFLFDGCRG